MFERKALGANILKYRKKRGLSQQELAGKLYVTAQSVSKWERGESQPDIANLCALAQVLEVSVDVLLCVQPRQAQKYMVAVDGGGTKTEFVLLDMQGSVCKQTVLGGSNPNIGTLEETCRVLQKGIGALGVPPEQVAGIFAGISGCGAEKNRQAVTDFLREEYPQARIQCDTDVLNVWGCVPEAGDCVLAICGTGSVVYAQKKGSLHRVGGWGYLLDSDGSGFGIGKDALKAALAWEDGIGPATEVASLVHKQLGGPVWEHIEELYSRGEAYIASFAPCVFRAYHHGDGAAEAILQRHFKRMAFLIGEAFQKYACAHTVLLSGGLLREWGVIEGILKRQLPADTRILVPEQPQAFGACVQCCRLCGVDTARLLKTFGKAGKKNHA